MSDAYDHTISGLLRKRTELFNEAIRLRERLAEIKNDIEALEQNYASTPY